MPPVLSDPSTYLQNSLKTRGKSGKDGVYLTNVTAICSATETFDGYPKVSPAWKSRVYQDTWKSLVYDVLNGKSPSVSGKELGQCFGYFSSLHFIVEDTDISCTAYLPFANLDSIQGNVVNLQDLLRTVASMTHLTPTTARIHIGRAQVSWLEVRALHSDENEL